MKGRSINKVLHNLNEATLTLYATAADGAPILATPLWMGYSENSLRLSEKWRVLDTRPTASAHPRHHPLAATYEIALSRPWVLQYPSLLDVVTTRRTHVLDVLWVDEDTGDWFRNVFYGVTIRERTREARDGENGFEDAQVWDAQYFVPSSGVAATAIPTISGTVPYVVRWVGSDGVFNLYSYDATTHVFTATASTTGRAVIAYDSGAPSTAAELTVIFAGDLLALVVDGNGLTVPAVRDDLPVPATLPRLDFMYGNLRVAVLTPDALYVSNAADSGVAAGSARFQLYGALGTLKATLAASGVVAEGLAA